MSKRLYRSQRERMLGGVCAGIADYFDVDVTLIRLVTILLAFAGGPGIIAYIIGWIIIPEEPSYSKVYTSKKENVTPSTEENDKDVIEIEPEEKNNKEDTENIAEPEDKAKPVKSDKSGTSSTNRNFGIILIIVGVFFLFRNYIPWFDWNRFWPVILIAVGVFFLISGRRGKKR